MKNFSTIKVNGRYLESRSPTIWTEDEIMAEPLEEAEVLKITKKILSAYHKHRKPCKIEIETIENE
jgi:hypothetical protein